jgi:anti-sigma factor RsiW
MSPRAVTDELLGAYVDGELDPADRALVARAIADDRALAARVAVLSRLKSVVTDTPRAPAGLAAAPGQGRTRAGARLGTVALLTVALLLAWQQQAGPDDPLPSSLDAASAAHQAWMDSRNEHAGTTATAAAAAVSALLMHVGNGVGPVPDLSVAGLRFAHVHPLDHTRAIHIGYQGSRGCMVSLVVHADGSAFPETLESLPDAGRTVYLWRAGGAGYLLMASRMPRARLDVVAHAVFEAVRAQRPLDQKATSRLMASRREFPPCAT